MKSKPWSHTHTLVRILTLLLVGHLTWEGEPPFLTWKLKMLLITYQSDYKEVEDM